MASPPNEKVRCDVLVLPHHGGDVPGLGALIDAADPELLLQSSPFHRDAQRFLKALAGRRRLSTHTDGWICIDLDPDKLGIRTMRGN